MSYPTDGNVFIVDGELYRWRDYAGRHIAPYGQTGRFQTTRRGREPNEKGLYSWKTAYNLVPGQKWVYLRDKAGNTTKTAKGCLDD